MLAATTTHGSPRGPSGDRSPRSSVLHLTNEAGCTCCGIAWKLVQVLSPVLGTRAHTAVRLNITLSPSNQRAPFCYQHRTESAHAQLNACTDPSCLSSRNVMSRYDSSAPSTLAILLAQWGRVGSSNSRCKVDRGRGQRVGIACRHGLASEKSTYSAIHPPSTSTAAHARPRRECTTLALISLKSRDIRQVERIRRASLISAGDALMIRRRTSRSR